ncbi:MAG: hypothetical protein RIB60_07965 [Phycisphaerales bacterium]
MDFSRWDMVIGWIAFAILAVITSLSIAIPSPQPIENPPQFSVSEGGDPAPLNPDSPARIPAASEWSFVSWTNRNAGFVQLIASLLTVGVTVTLVAVTVRYVKHTSEIAQETRRTREAAHRPQLLAYLSPHGGYWIVDFVIENVGTEPATDVLLTIKEANGPFNVLYELGLTQHPISLGPNGRIGRILGNARELLDDDLEPKGVVSLTYGAADGRTYDQEFTLSLKGLEKTGSINQMPEEAIAGQLKEVGRHIEDAKRSLTARMHVQDNDTVTRSLSRIADAIESRVPSANTRTRVSKAARSRILFGRSSMRGGR